MLADILLVLSLVLEARRRCELLINDRDDEDIDDDISASFDKEIKSARALLSSASLTRISLKRGSNRLEFRVNIGVVLLLLSVL